MRDLAIMHLANRASIEDVVNRGSVKQTKIVLGASVTPGQTVYDLETRVAMVSVRVVKDEIPMRLFTGNEATPPLGTFKFLTGTGPGGVDQLVMQTPPATQMVLTYSYVEDYAFVEFELLGTGMQYVSDVFVGPDTAPKVLPINNTRLLFRVPRAIERSVVVGNLRAIVPMDSSPFAATDIIFDIATRASFASGNRVLLQRFLTILMSPEGADLYNVLPRSLTLNPQGRSVIINRLTLAVNVASVRTIRSTPRNAPPDEILLNAFVEGVDIDDNNGIVDATVRMQTLAGPSFSAPLTLGA